MVQRHNFKALNKIHVDNIRVYEKHLDTNHIEWIKLRALFSFDLLQRKHNDSVKWWLQSLNHRFLCMLSISARFNVAPEELDIKENFVILNDVLRYLNCHADTAKEIIHQGIARKDLMLVQNPCGVSSRFICYSATDKLVRDILKQLGSGKEKTNYNIIKDFPLNI